MKKKLLITLLAATAAMTCALGLAACDNSDGDNNGGNENDGHVHDYAVSVVDPTCTEQGYTLHSCECGESYKDNYVDALDHDLQHHAAQEATCRNVGWNAYDTCSRCDYTTYEEISKSNHTYSNYICTSCYCVDPAAPDTEGLEFTLNDDGESYTLSGKGTASGEYLKIPAEYNGKPVTAVGEDAFYSDNSFVALYLPDSIKVIESCAFTANESLKSLTVPDSVTQIGDSAFYYCLSLEWVSFGEGLSLIGDGAFFECAALTSIEMSENIKEIGVIAFANCSNPTIKIPTSVTKIGGGAFSGCEILLDENNENFVLVDGFLFNSDNTELICYGGDETRTEYTIPNGVTICNYAFAFTPLEKIIVPEGITEIGNWAFTCCESLTSIKLPSTLKFIGDSAFEGCSSIESIIIPDGVTHIGSEFFTAGEKLTTITLPNSLIEIGDYFLADGCYSLTDIIFKGTMDEWKALNKKITSSVTIHCDDGKLNGSGSVIE